MPLNKEAILRYQIIDRLLQKGYPSMEDIQNACEAELGKIISTSTIQKDIKALKEDEVLGYLAPIRFSKKYNGYYYDKEGFTIRKINLNPNQTQALETLIDLLKSFGDSNLKQTIQQSVERILIDSKAVLLKDKQILLPEINPLSNFYILEKLIECILHQQVVKIKHQSYTKKKLSEIILHSYFIKQIQTNWFVIGFSEKHKDIRHFAINRIKEISHVKSPFKSSDIETIQEKYNQMYGCYAFLHEGSILNAESKTITFRASSISASYIEETPLHNSQKISKQTTRDTYFSIEVIPTKELIYEFIRLSDRVEVIEPLIIRNEIIRLLKISKDFYKRK